MRLQLDGVYELNKFIRDEKKELETHEKRCIEQGITKTRLCLYKVWSRITAPLHFALIIIRTIGGQIFRGSGLVISGVLTLDYHRNGKLISGLNDYLSAVVQAIVLPLFAIAAVVKPAWIADFLKSQIKKWDVCRPSDGCILQKSRSYKFFYIRVTIPLMIAAIPNVLLQQAALGGHSLLKIKFGSAGLQFLNAVLCILPICWKAEQVLGMRFLDL